MWVIRHLRERRGRHLEPVALRAFFKQPDPTLVTGIMEMEVDRSELGARLRGQGVLFLLQLHSGSQRVSSTHSSPTTLKGCAIAIGGRCETVRSWRIERTCSSA
jgi:hypothetical protein